MRMRDGVAVSSVTHVGRPFNFRRRTHAHAAREETCDDSFSAAGTKLTLPLPEFPAPPPLQPPPPPVVKYAHGATAPI